MNAGSAPPRVLFVTNGHGEASIAVRIAGEVRARSNAVTEHLALVGERFTAPDFPDVGPQRAMPSGGLVAMGNVRAFVRDLGAGWLALFRAQWRFLGSAARDYAVVVAVGDAYACALARRSGRPIVYVGTAKSVYVAKYGFIERRIIGAAARIFVRDAATAADLRSRGVAAEAPGNVIVDLLASDERFAWPSALRIAILPGSRERAYADAMRIAELADAVARRIPEVSSALSIAPGLDPARFAPVFARFPAIAPWRGPAGALVADATIAIGQAGTANEAAAAAGVAVIALDLADDPRAGWYRMRQERLLGSALLVVPGEPESGAAAVAALLRDPARRAAMAATGRERMGLPGGARAIGAAIVSLLVTPAGEPA